MRAGRNYNPWGLHKARTNLRYARINRALHPARVRPLASERFLSAGMARFFESWSYWRPRPITDGKNIDFSGLKFS
jgi:hypothetical protein